MIEAVSSLPSADHVRFTLRLARFAGDYTDSCMAINFLFTILTFNDPACRALSMYVTSVPYQTFNRTLDQRLDFRQGLCPVALVGNTRSFLFYIFTNNKSGTVWAPVVRSFVHEDELIPVRKNQNN